MLTPDSLDEHGQLHFDGSLILLYLFLAAIFINIGIIILSIFQIAGASAAGFSLTDTGTSLRFPLLAGYAQCSYRFLPESYAPDSPKLFAAVFLVLTLICNKLPIAAILLIIRRVLKSISHAHSPFIPETASGIRTIGIILVCMGFFGNLILQLGLGIIAYHTFWINNPLDFTLILTGLLILLISDIFRKGCDLQLESDETL